VAGTSAPATPGRPEVNNYLGVDLPTAHAQSARDLSLALTGAFG